MGKKVSDELLLTELLSGRSQRQIAKELGITQVTVSRRIRDPAFASQLSSYRKQILDATVTGLTVNIGEAVDVLVELLRHDSASIRLNAASKILQIAQEYSLQNDLLREIEQIKQEQDR